MYLLLCFSPFCIFQISVEFWNKTFDMENLFSTNSTLMVKKFASIANEFDLRLDSTLGILIQQILIKNNFVPVLKEMCKDKIPNVRMNIGKSISKIRR